MYKVQKKDAYQQLKQENSWLIIIQTSTTNKAKFPYTVKKFLGALLGKGHPTGYINFPGKCIGENKKFAFYR